MSNNESTYYTPEGCVDLPFMYVFDAAKAGAVLTDGTTVQNLIKAVEWDSDFILRAILGVPNVVDPVTGGFRFYNYSGSRAIGAFMTPFSKQYAVVPEKRYPPNGAIKFDLANILKAVNVCATNIPFSQIAFQGVKRYRPGTDGYGVGSPQMPQPFDETKYVRKPFYYPFTLNLNWFHWVVAATGLPDIPRRFVIEIQDFDFELHAIEIVNATTGAPLTAELIQIMLYDATAKRELSSIPVNASYLNGNRSAFGNPVFPVPPLLYPVWTQIRFDVTSLVCNTDPSAPYSLQLNFIGVQRVPKVGSPDDSRPGTGTSASGATGGGGGTSS